MRPKALKKFDLKTKEGRAAYHRNWSKTTPAGRSHAEARSERSARARKSACKKRIDICGTYAASKVPQMGWWAVARSSYTHNGAMRFL
jgi:hypothetical protein